jgi:uncharacterized membrane-anchored protein YjiN (DUF445 family)
VSFTNNYKATVTLGLVSVAFFASYPFHHNFWGGLITSGCEAAMVGGLADWFAVTALFRKPLGIPFRTAIIPRNREKIFNVLVKMVKDQILVRENIEKRLANYDLPSQVKQVLLSNNGKNIIKKLLYGFFQDVINKKNEAAILEIFNSILKEQATRIKIMPYLMSALALCKDKGYDEQLVDFVLDELFEWINTESFKQSLADWLLEVALHYEQGMSRRKIFNQLNDLSNTKLAEAAHQGLCSFLVKMKDPQHSMRQKLKHWWAEYFLLLETDEQLRAKIETWWQKTIIGNQKISQYIVQELLHDVEKVLLDTRRSIQYLDQLIAQGDMVLSYLLQNSEVKELVNKALQQGVCVWLDSHHDEIGNIVKTNLNELSNELLVTFIETKVGNDLQMIRINGSIVGGLAGMLLYVMTFWL